MYLTCESCSKFLDHVLQLVVRVYGVSLLPCRLLGFLLQDLHGEHDNLGSHGGHFVAEAIPVDAVHVRRKSVLTVALPLTLVQVSAIKDSWVNGHIPSNTNFDMCNGSSEFFCQYAMA